MTTEQRSGSYAANVSLDSEIGSTVILLAYEDKENPARNIVVGIVPELGSNMFSFRVGEHELIHTDLELLKRMDYTGNFVLWPFPNRVRDARYSYQGRDYSLEAFKQEHRPQGNSVLIHGLVFDRCWSYEAPVVTPDSAQVTTYIDITPESLHFAGYPFPCRLSLTYTVTSGGITITYHVHNTGEHDLPFGFALHPYFATLSGPQETLVRLPADAVMEADDELLPTGRVFDMDKIMYAMYDLRQPVPVANLKLDHAYTKVHPNEPATIDYLQQGMQLQIFGSSDFTHIVIFVSKGAGNSLCVEHQTCATDAINLQNRGPEYREMAHLLEVHPGEVATGTLKYVLKFQR